jgi:pilus assembly protein CpaE
VIAGLAAQQRCNLCIVDLAADQDQALATIGEAAPVAPVVGLNPPPDADVILRALRHGAKEFLAGASGEQVRALLDRLELTRAPSPARQGKLCLVVPGKPGCGASTLAAHLAAEAHRNGGSSVLLVDADPLTGSIGFLLKLKNERHLGDVLRDWKRMDDDLWTRLVTPWRGVDVVLAPEDPATRCPLGPETAAEMATFWRTRYDAILVDAPDARVAVESGLAAIADCVLLVATNELAALHATRRAAALLEQAAGARGRLRLVLNRYHPAAGLARDDVRTALDVEPFATVSNDYDALQRAVLEGKTAAGSRFAASVRALWQALEGQPAAPKKSGWLGRLASRK